MRQRYTLQDFAYSFGRGKVPVTKFLIAETVLMYLVYMISYGTGASEALRQAFQFQYPDWFAKPWTLVTYPLLTLGDPFSLLFAGLMLWWFGGSLERAWSSRVYAWFFFAIAAITALSLSIACFLFGSTFPTAVVWLLGVWMPLSAVTVAWAALNPEQEILLFFVLPVRAKYVGWATAALVAVSYVFNRQFPWPFNLVMAVFGLAGCAAAWQYVRYRTYSPGSYRQQTPVVRLYRRKFQFPNPFRSLKEKRDQERLRKLFGEDKDDGWR